MGLTRFRPNKRELHGQLPNRDTVLKLERV
jgi:hypothetical protein